MMTAVALAFSVGVAGAVALGRLAAQIAPGPLSLPRWRQLLDALTLSSATFVATVVATPAAQAVAGLVALAATLTATHVDLAYRKIPNRLTYPLPFVLAGIVVVGRLFNQTQPHLVTAVTLGILAPAVLWSLSAVYARYTGLNGFGMGDIKLVGSLTFAVGLAGPRPVAIYAYATFVSAALLSSVLLLAGRATRQTRVAFAPYFAVGVVTATVVLPLIDR